MKRIFLLFLSLCICNNIYSETNWLVPSPRTIYGVNDRIYYQTDKVWMNQLNVGGTTGTNGLLIINGIIFDGYNDLELVYSITNSQYDILNLQIEDQILHGLIDTNSILIQSNSVYIGNVSNALNDRLVVTEDWIVNYSNTVINQILSNKYNIELLFDADNATRIELAIQSNNIVSLSNLVETFDTRITSNRNDIEVLFTNDTLQRVVQNSGGITATATGLFTRTVVTNIIGHYLFYNTNSYVWEDSDLLGEWYGHITNIVGIDSNIFYKTNGNAKLYFITNAGVSNGWFISKNNILNPIAYYLSNSIERITSNEEWTAWGLYNLSLGKVRWVDWQIDTNDLTKTIKLFDTNCNYTMQLEGDLELVNVNRTYLDNTNNVLPLWALDERYCNSTNTDWQYVVNNGNIVTSKGWWYDWYFLTGWSNLVAANDSVFIRDTNYVKQPCWKRLYDTRSSDNDDRLYFETSYDEYFWVINFGGSPKVFTTSSDRPDSNTVWVIDNGYISSGFSGPIGITIYNPTQEIDQIVKIIETNIESKSLSINGILELTQTHTRNTNNVLPMWMNDFRYAPTSAVPYLESTKIDKDGSIVMEAALNLGTNRLINVSNIVFSSTNTYITNLGVIVSERGVFNSRVSIKDILHMNDKPVTNIDYIQFDNGTIFDENTIFQNDTKFQCGTNNPSTFGLTEKIISFTNSFATVPIVTCNLGENVGMQITIDIIDVSVDEFKYIQRSSSGIKTNDWLIRWIAVRP